VIFLVVSDLHFEFHADGGDALLAELAGVACDGIIIAGDLADSRTLMASVKKVCSLFPQVAYITENHDFKEKLTISLQ